MRNKKVPDHGLERFRMRSDILGIYGRYDAACVGYFGGVSAVPAHDAQNGCAGLLGVPHRVDDVAADVLFQIAATDGEHQDRVPGAQAAALQPIDKAALPTVVIDPSGQLRHVVRGRVGFHAADLAEVVDGMSGVAGG